MSLQYIIAHTKVKGPIIGQNYFPLESVPDPGKCFSSSLQFCYSSTRVERVNRRRRRKKKKKKRERHLTWEPQNGSFSRARSIRAIYFKICLGKRREEKRWLSEQPRCLSDSSLGSIPVDNKSFLGQKERERNWTEHKIKVYLERKETSYFT